mgnify:CR=1 FL=1
MTSRVYEHPLSPELACSILDIPVSPMEGPEPRTIRERLTRMHEAVSEANAHLAVSPVAKIVARSLMLDLKKRGEASIVVKHDGAVVLRVMYGAESISGESGHQAFLNGAGTHPRRDVPGVTSNHQSDLPYLDALREEARKLCVDVSHLGRQRRAINEYLAPHRVAR